MAIVTRRYIDAGPTAADLANQVSASTTPVVVAQYGEPIVDINVDNAFAGLIETLDEFMALHNFVPSATASPKQVFAYTANGAEGTVFTIDAAKGFIARVTANYAVHMDLCRPNGNALKITSIINGAMTSTQFDVELSPAIEAGDVLMFTVEDLS